MISMEFEDAYRHDRYRPEWAHVRCADYSHARAAIDSLKSGLTLEPRQSSNNHSDTMEIGHVAEHMPLNPNRVAHNYLIQGMTSDLMREAIVPDTSFAIRRAQFDEDIEQREEFTRMHQRARAGYKDMGLREYLADHCGLERLAYGYIRAGCRLEQLAERLRR